MKTEILSNGYQYDREILLNTGNWSVYLTMVYIISLYINYVLLNFVQLYKKLIL